MIPLKPCTETHVSLYIQCRLLLLLLLYYIIQIQPEALRCFLILWKWKISNSTKIISASIQLLYDDWKTDTQAHMMKELCCFESCLEHSGTSYFSYCVSPRCRGIIQIYIICHWPCRKSYCMPQRSIYDRNKQYKFTPCSHLLFNFCTKNTHMSFKIIPLQ